MKNSVLKHAIEDHEIYLQYEVGFSSKVLSIFIVCQAKRMKVSLNAEIKSYKEAMVVIEDLQGNGYGSGFQRMGYGTLAFNLALQILKAKCPDTTKVDGMLSGVGDPENLAGELMEGRRAFWKTFGFGFHKKPRGEWIDDHIISSLADLHIVADGHIKKTEIPKYIPLDQFNQINKMPYL